MVLIGNNSILTIEKWHKNRCMEKNQVRDVLFQIKHKKDEFMVIDIVESVLQGEITNGPQNNGTYSIETKKHDCKKNHT